MQIEQLQKEMIAAMKAKINQEKMQFLLWFLQ